MLVYRVCSKDEVDKIFQNSDFSTIGSLGEEFNKYKEERDINNHRYDPTKLYLHFFDDIWSILYWRAIKGNYVCTYDIPDDILANCFGIGKYLSKNGESDNRSSVGEYAVESNMIRREYLIRVELITADMDFADDDCPEILDDYFKTVYERELRKQPYRSKAMCDEDIKQLIEVLMEKNQKKHRN